MQAPDSHLHGSLNQIIERVWKTQAQSVILLGEGVYGKTYGVTLPCVPYRAALKVHTYPHLAARELRQLIEFYTHFPDLVPQVYTCLSETEQGSVIVMEWLSGYSCAKSEPLCVSLQRQVVDLLLKIHAISHQEGYGAFDGPFYRRWWDYYGQRVRDTYQVIKSSEDACSYLGSRVLALMERTLTYGEQIVGTSQGKPVLLHGDFCFGNLLFDAHTQRISGLIDPLDAEWGERELDLVNLINGHVLHFELLNRYREKMDVDAHFPLRYWFYQVWKWLFYYVRVQTPCREWVLRCGRELEKAMDC